ncbi:MAG: hypothetical protein WA173_11005 [Pseudomonas sp.]|uniref:hypothetical protein n=1 Tax=Pseudomonas sp. TaxID=306 RepID=UPI003BB6EAF9
MKKPFNTGHTDQPLADEQALLEHYRQHSLAQPSPAMDALILAAAAAELKRARPIALPWSQRLHGWLFGPGHRVRWSVAFASLASIGLGLGLSLRTVQELPPAYELGEPLPAMSAAPAPASAPLAEPMSEAKELKKLAAPAKPAAVAAPPSPVVVQDKTSSYSKAESAPVLGELKANSSVAAKQQAADVPAASLTDSAAKADNGAELAKVKAAPTLEQQLRALLQLQRSGATQAATAELERLQLLYPEHDLAAELVKMRASQP